MCDNKSLKFIVRQMKASDLEEVKQTFTSRHIFATKYHNDVMVKVDPNGLFVAQDLNTGMILGFCSGVNITPDLAFIGQYEVRREFQKLGIGSQIWAQVMEHIGPNRTVGLYTVPPMSDLYRDKYNFTIHRSTHCYDGKVDFTQLTQAVDGISVVPMSDQNIQKVIQYDKQIWNGLDRTVLIEENAKILEYVSRVAMNQLGQVVGYCVLKVSTQNKGFPEPLYANDQKIAELLLAKTCEGHTPTLENGMIYRSPSVNSKSDDIAKKLDLKLIRNSVLMSTKPLVDGDMDRVFCGSNGCFYPF